MDVSDKQPAEPATAPSASPTAVGEIGRQVAELQEYVSFLIDSKIDAAKATLRRAMIGLVAALLAVFTLCIVTATGCVFLLSGIAQGLALWMGTGAWLGYLVVGALVIIGVGGGLYIAINRINRRNLERTQARYEKRKAEQLARFGHSVETSN